MNVRQDFFISHAGDDKRAYIQPLAERLTARKVTFWLDSREVRWGDSLALKINDGLRESRHVVLCLSEAFISRPWPETELNSAFAARNPDDNRRILPLILNGKDRILAEYPLIGGLVYREWSDPDAIAHELASLVRPHVVPDDSVDIVIESAHSGRLSNLTVPLRCSAAWLATQAQRGIGLRDSLDTGGFQPFSIRWVLVDRNAEDHWKAMDRRDREETYALVIGPNGVRRALHPATSLSDIDVYDGIVFHLYAVEDVKRNHADSRGGLLGKIFPSQ
jgi:hypothetical protein